MNGRTRKSLRTTFVFLSVTVLTFLGQNGMAHAQGLFLSHQRLKEANKPYYTALNDMNGDGVLDIVCSHFGDLAIPEGSVSIRYGNGDGTFQGEERYRTGYGPLGIGIGDLNSDGLPDIVTADYSNLSVSVLLADGAGGFLPHVEYTVGEAAYGLKLADLNGDGFLDIAVVCEYEDTLSILLNNGDGTFAARAVYPAGSHASEVEVVDLNGDTFPDVIVSNFRSDTLGVYLNNGNGTLGAMTTFPTGSLPFKMVVADFNGDGFWDVAVANYNGGTLGFHYGNGDGTFAPRFEIDAGTYPSQMVYTDMDGDGLPDFVVTNDFTTSITALYGKDNFLILDTYAAGQNPYGIAAGDLDGDGKPDLAVANRESDDVSVLLQAELPTRLVSGQLTLEGLDFLAARTVTFTFRPDDGSPDIVRVSRISSDGDFVLAGIPVQSYTLHIKGDQYLAVNLTVDTTPGDATGLTATLLAGDANNDNSADALDLAELITAFNAERWVDPGYSAAADFNGDGFNDALDLALLISNFNLEGAL